jgi:hypothetical protein
MKTKLVPLGLLIPAVVLAQPAPPAPAPQPPSSTMQAPTVNPANPANPAKAAAALSTAKELSNRLKDGSLSSRKPYCGEGYTTISVSLCAKT